MRLGIGMRLGLAFTALTACAVVVGVFSIGRMGQIGDGLREVGHVRAQTLELVCNGLSLAADQAREVAHVVGAQTADEFEKFARELEEVDRKEDQIIAAAEKAVDSESERQAFARLEGLQKRLEDALARSHALAREG
ncbi:MAG TPA: MCP four helix bundle domain-containing protein, partial [Anaeromyxobacteraceae bacterium]|nr:MCP four helix bundle domain-containing protein [Anaeromyxobacteraceae bacterium]